ncbi:MAG: urea ABC transporter permease subunit UrtB, partial [Pseudomonas sp.]
MYRLLLTLLLLLPLATQAGEGEFFLTAKPNGQASLLEGWAAQPDPARLALLENLREGRIGANDSRKVRLNNRLRGLIDNALASHQLLSDQADTRLAAARQLQKTAQPAQMAFLDRRFASETDSAVHAALGLALANLQLVASEPAVRLAAVRLLGETGDPVARTRLEALLQPGVETDANVRTAAETSLAQVKRKLLIGEVLGQAFSGLSLGSILLLAALGLAITFGLLGVINMAHGEMLMLGAYATYVVQVLIQRYAPAAIEFYPLIALPVAFCVSAGVGMLLERTVIRHLYGRPLETLLATWGISLILIQAIRLLFGAQNVEVANPAWLSGGIQVLPNLVLP